jgi:hypothetical protein
MGRPKANGQPEKCRVTFKTGKELEDGVVEEDDGFGFGIWGVAEEEEVSVRAEAAEDGGTGWGVKANALVSDGNPAVVTDAYGGLLTPDKGPPRAVGKRSNDGAFFLERLLPGGLWRRAEFAMDFMLVGMRAELFEQRVGAGAGVEVVGEEERGQAVLPVIMAAFDFAFGLRGGSEFEGHAVEVKGGA